MVPVSGDRRTLASTDVIGAPLHEALDKAGAVEELNADRKNELDASIDAGSTAGE